MARIMIALVSLFFLSTPSLAKQLHPWILGGQKVQEKTLLRATVGIEMTSDNPFMGSSFCTGSYIGHNRIVTAAHCTKKSFSEVTFVTSGGQHKCRVEKIKINPAFKDVSINTWEDIAVVEVKCEDLDLSTVPHFELPENPQVPGIADITFAGYGVSSQSGSPTFPELNQISHERAFEFEDGGDPYLVNLKEQIRIENIACFESSDQKAFHLGDSGGPVFYKNPKGKLVLHGVISVNLVDNNGPIVADCFPTVSRFREFLLGPM